MHVLYLKLLLVISLQEENPSLTLTKLPNVLVYDLDFV